jgi:hypothetical protein
MGTDLNTPPLFVVMAIPAWTILRGRTTARRGQSGHAPALDRKQVMA